MILGSYERLPVGQRLSDGIMVDGACQKHRQPVLVLREVTVNEWIAWCRDNGNEPTSQDLVKAKGAFFYEVATD